MSFTYPFFLWGLSALAIPIIIHLFNFRKAKRVSFSNVRFLESIKKKSSSNLRLRHLLILLSRLLFIFFLVLTFAQPFIPGQEDGLKNESVWLYLDNSNSLSNLTENDLIGFNELLDVSQKIIDLYPQETKFSLITNDFLPGSSISRSKTKALEQLTEIEYSNLARSGQEVFNKLLSNQKEGSKDIFLLTDFQQSTFGVFESIVDSSNQYHLVTITTPEQRNISIDTLFLTNPFLVSDQKNSISIRVKNQGPVVNDLQVKLNINNKQSGTTSIDIEPNSSQTVTFELTGSLEKTNRCFISFEDFPVTFDNDYYFTLNQASKINIVEVTDQINSPVSKVYQNNDLFNFTAFPSENISYPTLEKADLLIINGVKSIENGLKAQIEKQLKEGKSVIFLPKGDGAHLYEFAGISIIKDSSAITNPLSIPDLNNPFFKNMFETIGSETQMPEVSAAYSWNSNDIPLLETKTNQIYLSHAFQKGNLFLFSSPLAKDYSNLHQHALFVPVMHRIAELSSTNTQALAYSVDQINLSLAVDSIPNGQLYKLQRKGTELIPSQRVTANELVLDMPKYLLTPGYYDVMLGEKRMTTIAFNHSKKESNLATLPLEEIRARLTGIQHLNVYQPQDAASFSEIMKEKYHQRDLWKYTLILSLIFLFAESVLLRFL